MNSRSNETDGSIYTVNGQSYISLTYYQLNSLLAIIRLMHENIGCMLTSSNRNHTNFWDYIWEETLKISDMGSFVANMYY